MSDETAALIVEFKSTGGEAVRREGQALKESTIKSAKESAAVFVEAYKERDRLAAEWQQRLKERDAAEAVMAKQRGITARAELAKTASAERQAALDRQNQFRRDLAIEIAQIKAKNSQELLLKKQAYAAQVAEAKKAAAEERAAKSQATAASSGTGFRVAIGAVAGQGLSIGGLASVNPYVAAGVAAAYAVKRTTQDLVAQATIWEKFKVALTDIEGSAVKAEQATNNLYELAKAPGISLKEAEQTYLQFRALNIEGAKAEKIIKAISNAVALSGGGSEEFGRVNLQITQMLSKGKVLEEDLRVMRNSMPRLTQAMREAFGTTTAEGIRKLGLNAEQFLNGVVTQFEKLPKATQTLESAQENAATAWSRFKASLVPDVLVKGSVAGWTSILEGATSVIETFRKTVAKTKEEIGVEELFTKNLPKLFGSDKKTSEKFRYEYGFSAQQTAGLATGNNSSFTQAGSSYAAYAQTIDAAKGKPEVLDKALKSVRIENEKLAGQLAGATKYEQDRLAIISEYKQRIEETDKIEEKKLLKIQQNLRLRILAKQHAEEEAAALRSVVTETDRLVLQNSKLDAFTKERLQIEADFADSIEKATINQLNDPAKLAALQAQKSAKLAAVDAKEAQALQDQVAATERLLVQNSQLGEFAKRRLEIETEYNKKIEEAANSQIAGELAKQKAIALANVDRSAEKAGDEFSAKYSYGVGIEKLTLEFERERALVVDATYRTGEERNRVMKALNDKYLADQAAMYTQVGTTVTSAGQSLFNDLASSVKMGIDYRYNIEKAGIEKTYSLYGLEGAARVEQQKKRDEALQQLDERRQNQLQGNYLTMFMIAKGFALAESVLKLNLAIVEAAASGPFPANLAAMATVAASVGSVVSNVAAISYAGAYDKGGDIPAGSFGMVGENGYEFVQGPAHVTSTRDTAAILEAAGRAPVVNITNYTGQTVQVQQGTNPGDLEIIVGEVSKRVEDQLATGVRSGRGQLSGAMQETYGLNRKGAW